MPKRRPASQLAAAAAAGLPPLAKDFPNDAAWHDEDAWVARQPNGVHETLPQRGDKARRTAWQRMTKQHAATMVEVKAASVAAASGCVLSFVLPVAACSTAAVASAQPPTPQLPATAPAPRDRPVISSSPRVAPQPSAPPVPQSSPPPPSMARRSRRWPDSIDSTNTESAELQVVEQILKIEVDQMVETVAKADRLGVGDRSRGQERHCEHDRLCIGLSDVSVELERRGLPHVPRGTSHPKLFSLLELGWYQGVGA